MAKKQKRKPRKTDKKQSERFKKAAREFGLDETGKSFEEVFGKLVPPRTSTKERARR